MYLTVIEKGNKCAKMKMQIIFGTVPTGEVLEEYVQSKVILPIKIPRT